MKVFLNTVLFLLIPKIASAHVKWFSEFAFSDKPSTITETLTPSFWALLSLSVVVIGFLTFINNKLAEHSGCKKTIAWVESYKEHSLTLMRAGAAAVLLLSFQSDSLFVPELKVAHSSIGWISFLAAFLLIFPKTVTVSGLIIMSLYIYGLTQFGWFHMLDYLLFLGAGYYLSVAYSKRTHVQETGLIALYSTVGFSLCWVAIEKILYPQWSMYILEQNPHLAMGMNFDFFLLAAAFIEFALGYLMIICLLQRPLAIIITAVFFTTTLVFGKLEIIGHTLVHCALIVFIMEGAGKAHTPPIDFHKRLRLRIPFAVVNFVLLLFILLFSYQRVAMAKYGEYVQKLNTVAGVDVTGQINTPELDFEVQKDSGAGWNLHLKTTNFRFAPKSTGAEHVYGEGHAHLYINDKKIGRIYSDWYYIPTLPLGDNEIKVTLNTNDHKLYVVSNEPIEKVVSVNVSESTNSHQNMQH